MPLSLKETQGVTGLVEVLYEFLPGSGNAAWSGHVNFGTVAAKVGVGNFWPGGSKKLAISTLISQTLEYKRGSFQPLILEIVRSGIAYRERQGNPIKASEIDVLNGHIYEIGFKFPELWDRGFRDSLHQTTAERAEQSRREAEREQQELVRYVTRTEQLRQLKEQFLALSAEIDRSKAGLALEKLLNKLFEVDDLSPRPGFRIKGEQIDGSFALDGKSICSKRSGKKTRSRKPHCSCFAGKSRGNPRSPVVSSSH
ncbi:MAG: hypothetical protein WDO56_28360 [Gammaproteobacteria bacterium]